MGSRVIVCGSWVAKGESFTLSAENPLSFENPASNESLKLLQEENLPRLLIFDIMGYEQMKRRK